MKVTCALLAFSFLTVLCVASARQKVILLLADGLRWDRYGEDLPNLMQVEQDGVRADWMDGVFVTLSIPSMYSIATGLYPESHGAIHNQYFDYKTGNRTLSYGATLNVTEWFDTGAEPVWVTAIMQGLSAGVIMYPGGQTPIKGIMPSTNIPWTGYDADYTMKKRVDDAVKWLDELDYDIVFVYFDNPDFVNHIYGIGDEQMMTTLYEVDDNIGYLFERLAATGLDQTTNVLIVSDHGHINVDTDKVLMLEDYIDMDDLDFRISDYGPLFMLSPKEGLFDKVYNSIKDAHPAMPVYKREDIPERLHYKDNSRFPPIIGWVDPGWHVHSRAVLHPAVDVASDHGYDNAWMTMKSSFYAQGPYFRKGYRAPALESVDLYSLMCEILELDPAPNNGSRARYTSMLASSAPPNECNAANPVVSASLPLALILLLASIFL